MLTKLLTTSLVIAGTMLAAVGQEKRIIREQLPPAVSAAIDHATKGTTIKGYSREQEHGRFVYEVETIAADHTKDFEFSSDGTLNEIEEQVNFQSLPENVRSALRAKADGARLTKVESLTKNGTLVAYEAATVKNSKEGEVQVGPRGETLAHEE
jgi:uncharacterized membrane protein YkoI